MTVLIGLFFLLAAEMIWIVEPAATVFISIETICGFMCLALATAQHHQKKKEKEIEK